MSTNTLTLYPPLASAQFFHVARSTVAAECRTVRENRSNSRPNGDWIADKAAPFSPAGTHGRPFVIDENRR